MGIVLREKLNLKESFSQLKVVFILALVLAGLIITTAVIAAPAVAEENPQQWDSLWIGPSNNDDVPHCLAADGKGNLYAIINSVGTGQAVNYLVKFDKDGNEQWPIKLGPIREYTYTVAADNDGNVVTYGGSPATVTKYNSDGKLLWSYVVATNDASRYVAIGNLGDVYITAGLDLTIGDSTESDAIVIKYDKDGNRKWYKSFGTSENETVRGIAVGGPVDGQEVIYVAGATNGSFPGHTFSGNANDGYVAKFLSDGTQDWIEQQNGLDYTDIVADSVGNAYLTETELSYGTPAAISTAVYTKEGKVIRRIPLDSFLVKGYSAGYPSNIAIDPSRNIYVCGAYPKDGSWIPSLLIEKYSPTGNLVGEKRIDIPGVGFPSFELVTGKNGDLYTCYFTNQDMGSNMDYNAHFVKYQGDDYDSDEDGLPDRWETEGVTINGEFIDLPAMGAKPDHKDIFVEVDWMSGREPQKGALDIVRNAYKNAPVENLDGITGINLHIDEGKDKVMDSYTGKLWGDLSKANQTPYVKNLGSFSSGNYNWDEFDQIKNGVETYSPNFDKSRKPIFHYCLFANDYSPNHSSGLSRDNPASDFIVSLGGWNGGKGGTALQQAGTFMHELGHNLGLRHGGVDHISYKPNYLSIMNYAFQTDGLRKLTGDGKTFAGGNFDYSIFNDILNLDTENLNENDGLLSLSNNELLNNYGTEFYFVAPLSAGGGVLTESTNGPRPIDWDRSGGPYLDRVSAPYIAVGPNGDGESGNMVLEAGGEDWHHLVCKGGSIGQLGAINDDLPQQTPVIPEFTWEDEVAQGHEYYVSVTAPENTGIKPGGSSVDYTFTVTNTGQKADTYMLSATSSASWADLTDFPQTISLSPGESTDISINVAVPPDSSETQDELILKATSQETANIWDSSKVVTVLQPDSLGTEQQITSYDGKNATDIIGAAIYGDWVVWADRLHVYPAPTNYYAKNIVSGEKRLIASVNIGNYSLVSFDIFGNMVVYQTDNVIGIYDLSTGTTRQITPGSGEKGFRPRIYGDKVVYESNDCLYVYDLTQNTEQMISDNSAYEWEIYGDRIVWTKPLEEYSYLNDLCVYDLSTNIESTIKSSLSLNHVDIYDNKIVWEDDRTNYWRVYRYDLVTNTEKEVTTFSDPNRSWWNEHWPVMG
ncbi:MAG TPA: hypothetical protein VHQ70_08805 [Syntrophomonadaceae bacterium]|nr:hypothetical protein [Syntrophomonadaceae bacterium]